MRLLCVFLIVFSMLQSGHAQTSNSPPATQSTTPEKPLSTERQLRKLVSFIKMSCTNSSGNVDLNGTGFFVVYPDQRLGKDGGFGYLVTNRHLAECWDENRHPQIVRQVEVILNRNDGRAVGMQFDGNLRWVFPTDPSVDLAIFPMLPGHEKYDYMDVSTETFLDDDSVLSEGDTIMFSGFFYQFPGVSRMQPIVREGMIAMLPDEDMNTTTGTMGKVYLGEVHAFGGNSGSPVLVNIGGFRHHMMGDSYRMLGVVSGGYSEDSDFKLEVTTTLTGTMRGNSGIAMIVPAKQLKTLLDDPRLKAQRDNDPVILKQQSATAK